MNTFIITKDPENPNRDILSCQNNSLTFKVFDDNREDFTLLHHISETDAAFVVDTENIISLKQRTLHFLLIHENPIESELTYNLLREAVSYYCIQKKISTEDLSIYGANNFTYGTYDVPEESDGIEEL